MTLLLFAVSSKLGMLTDTISILEFLCIMSVLVARTGEKAKYFNTHIGWWLQKYRNTVWDHIPNLVWMSQHGHFTNGHCLSVSAAGIPLAFESLLFPHWPSLYIVHTTELLLLIMVLKEGNEEQPQEMHQEEENYFEGLSNWIIFVCGSV